MSEVDVIDVGRNALWVVIKVAGPIMFLGLISGLIIALFQALTTIQEMTLTFVPKIIVIFLSMLSRFSRSSLKGTLMTGPRPSAEFPSMAPWVVLRKKAAMA